MKELDETMLEDLAYIDRIRDEQVAEWFRMQASPAASLGATERDCDVSALVAEIGRKWDG